MVGGKARCENVSCNPEESSEEISLEISESPVDEGTAADAEIANPGMISDAKPGGFWHNAGTLTHFLYGIWMAAVGGSLYAFPAFQVELKGMLLCSAASLASIYSAGQIAVGFSTGGYLYDTWGARSMCAVAAILALGGSWLLQTGLHEGASVVFVAICFFCLQHASAITYQAALFSNVNRTPKKRQGMVSGVISAGYGMSAGLWTWLYRHFFENGHLAGFLVALGMTCVATACFAMPILKDFGGGADKVAPQKYQRFDDIQDVFTTEFEIPPGLVGRTLEGGGVLSRNTSDRGIDPAGEEEPARLPAGPSRGPEWLKTNAKPMENVVEGEDFEDVKEVVGRPAAALPEKKSWVRDMLPNREYWLCILTFALLQGVGSGTFLSNLGLMCESLGFTADNRLNIVMFASFFNCLGRVASGFAMDYLYKFGVPKSAHFCITGFFMFTTCILLVIFPSVTMASPWTVSLFMAVIVGCYGANWAILPSVLAVRYDPRHLGMNFCAGSASMSLVVWSLAWLTGRLYDLASVLTNAPEGDAGSSNDAAAAAVGSEVAENGTADSTATTTVTASPVWSCTGYHCFRGAHIAGAIVALAGVFSAIRLVRKVRANDLSGAREYT